MSDKYRYHNQVSYKTKAFYLVCYLLCLGFEMSFEDDNDGRKVFIFENTNELQSVIHNYYNGQKELLVDFREVEKNIKALKSIIHND